MSDGASWGDSKEYRDARATTTHPYESATREELAKLVREGLECEVCDGRGKPRPNIYTTLTLVPGDCPTCAGTGRTPLPSGDLDALSAKWCGVEECKTCGGSKWMEDGDIHGYIVTVRCSACREYSPTTDPGAAMRLQERYGISTHPHKKGWFAGPKVTHADIVNRNGVRQWNESLCRAITEAALLAALEAGDALTATEHKERPMPSKIKHNIHGVWDYPAMTIRQRIRFRIRFRIAGWLDNHTQMCWSQLVSWALYAEYKFFDGNDDFSSVTCRKEACELGTCHCGKFKDEMRGQAKEEWWKS